MARRELRIMTMERSSVGAGRWMRAAGWMVWAALAVAASPHAVADEKWVADEIFLQISDLRKEVQALREKVADLERKLGDGGTQRKPVSLKDTQKMTLGRENAPVAVVSFSDYECPYCGKHALKVLPKLTERYLNEGKVRYVMRDFPLAFHSQARKAAVAARCAGEQGKYWPMHDAIFAARQLGDEVYGEAARKLGLKPGPFDACLKDAKQARAVEQDIALGESLGVQGTPAFFVGRVRDGALTDYKRLDGVQSFEVFTGVIDGLLDKR